MNQYTDEQTLKMKLYSIDELIARLADACQELGPFDYECAFAILERIQSLRDKKESLINEMCRNKSIVRKQCVEAKKAEDKRLALVCRLKAL